MIGGTKEVKFDVGDFVTDWYNCMKYVIFIPDNEKEPVSHSSTVNHFIMDGAPYDSAYLKFDEDGKPYLDYEYDRHNQGLEFFVPRNTQPTWEQLRALAGDPKSTKKTKSKSIKIKK
jgi:hypothetical protein